MNYIIKSGLLALCISVSFPIFGLNGHFLFNKNEPLMEAVVKASLNKTPTAYPSRSVQIRKVVIDAGHGGKDHGCGGHHSNEKHIVLDIAKQVKAKLREYHPELEVIMTREHDVFIPLYKRIEVANENNADLFISIHCNSLDIKSVRGTETYVMGLHTAVENLAVAKRENDVILLEQDYLNNYEGFDPHSDEGHIMLAMSQNEHLTKSINFANKLEKSFAKRTTLKSRGVKQAGFVVLKRATMPSVLIETGFISNQQDEDYLMSKAGKESMAGAIVKAFTLYKRELDEEQNNYNEIAVSTQISKPYKPTTSTRYTTTKTVSNRLIQPHEINDPNHHKIMSVSTSVSAKPIPSSQVLSTTVQQQSTVTDINAPINVKRFRVQIAASVSKPIAQQSAMWQQVSDISIKQEGNMYKYLTGNFISLGEANLEKSKLRKLGFKGAFVVAYEGEDRINL